ncbi:hypothetical protein PFISCL1PPCAC_23762, partial [Pristionchus fissidentatus]
FMPPYFKDINDMCPPQNEEMKRKLACMTYDPLLKEERKWSAADLRLMHRAVRNAMVEQKLTPFYSQRELILDKIRAGDATTTEAERNDWNFRLDALNRKIEFVKNLPDKDILTGDYSEVDWATIAMVYFKGHRTPAAIRLKWCNEQSPEWSKEKWTSNEVKKLAELATTDFISWSLIADKLGTRRTPWQCFEKYKSEISNEILKRDWTQEEDERLVKLVLSLQLNGVIQWDKVTYHMAGRTRQQCRTRYLRTLDSSIKHGRWTDEEDLLLMCSVGRYGARDWKKIAKGVPGRSDGQCRERWVNVLDRANRAQEWTMEEDEKLLYAVNMFGKGQWAKISSVLPGRSGPMCKSRFRSLLTTKMRICAAQLSKIRSAQRFSGYRSHNYMKRDASFAEFNRLLGGNDETGEAFCQRAREAADQKFNPRVKTVDPEVLRVVEEGMKGIEQKYSKKKQGEDMTGELFEEIVETQAKKSEQWLPVEFDPEMEEDKKCDGLIAAICQVIGKQDQLIALKHQENNFQLAEEAVAAKMREILEDAVRARVAEANEIEREGDGPSTSRGHPPRLSPSMGRPRAIARRDLMKPTAATAHAAELLMAELPRIAQIATPLLTGYWSGEKLTSMDQVESRLTATLCNHKEYAQLRELLRSLLIEPLMLVFSLEDDQSEQRSLLDDFNRMKAALMADAETNPPKKRASRAGQGKKKAGESNGRAKKTPTRKGVGKKETVIGEIELDAPPPPRAPIDNSIWDANDDDDEEFPVDWENEKEVEKPAPAKKTPKGRVSFVERATEGAEAVPSSAKKPTRPSRAKKTPASKTAPEVAEKAPAGAMKRARSVVEKGAEMDNPAKRGRESASLDADPQPKSTVPIEPADTVAIEAVGTVAAEAAGTMAEETQETVPVDAATVPGELDGNDGTVVEPSAPVMDTVSKD